MIYITTLKQSFSPLRTRNFRLYFGGQAVSLIGTWLQATAQSLLVYQLSDGSARALGIVTMLNTVPLLLSPWAGTLADRLERRKLLIFTQASAMLLAFLLAILTQIKVVELWHVYLLTALLGAVSALDLPAGQAFIGDLTGMGEVRKGINLNTMIIQVSRMIGPALAGYLIGAFGITIAFWLNGVSFLAVIASLMMVRTTQHEALPPQNINRSFDDALRFIHHQPRLQDVLMLVVMLVLFAAPTFTLIPILAKGNAEQTGLLLAAAGLGSLASVVFVVPLAQGSRRTGLGIASAALWSGIWLIALPLLSRSLPLMVICLFMSSLGQPVISTTALRLVQVLAPSTMRARLSSVFIAVILGVQPVAAVLIGYGAEWLGTPTVILVGSLALVFGTLLLLVTRPDFRSWEITTQSGDNTQATKTLIVQNNQSDMTK